MATYARARKDFEYLETITPLNDWVELMSDLESFMKNPNKQYGMGMYERAIGLWFNENGTNHNRRIDAIAERWGAF